MATASSYIGSLVESSPDGFVVATVDGCIEYASRRGVELLGAGSRIVGRTLDELVVPEDRPRLAALLLEGESLPVELRIERRPGDRVWLEANADRVSANGRDATVLVVRDVSHRKRIEWELRAAKAAVEVANERLTAALQDVEHTAATDRLTGLWNRRHFESVAAAEIARCRRFGHIASLALFDVDHFKSVNDRHGHNTGDRVLASVAGTLAASVRGSDTPCRWGGEEFVVLAPSVSAPAAVRYFDRIRAAIRAAHPGAPVGVVTVSVGVAQLAPGEELTEWLSRADEALYRAKRGGRDRVELAAAETDSPEHRLVQLVWDPSLECGDDVVDEEHRELFVLGNALMDRAMVQPDPAALATSLEALLAHVVRHFGDEEAMLARIRWPGLEAHAKVHHALVDEALRLRDRLVAGTLGIDEVVRFLVVRVVHDHVVGADTKFFPWVEASRNAERAR